MSGVLSIFSHSSGCGRRTRAAPRGEGAFHFGEFINRGEQEKGVWMKRAIAGMKL